MQSRSLISMGFILCILTASAKYPEKLILNVSSWYTAQSWPRSSGSTRPFWCPNDHLPGPPHLIPYPSSLSVAKKGDISTPFVLLHHVWAGLKDTTALIPGPTLNGNLYKGFQYHETGVDDWGLEPSRYGLKFWLYLLFGNDI